MLSIEVIKYEDIKKHIDEIKKYQLCFCASTKYYGLFDDETLVGFAGTIIQSEKIVFKNDYILESERGKGLYKYLMNYRMFIAKNSGNKIKKIEATCTSYSIKTYLKYGFKLVKEYKNGCKKVIYENL